MTCLTLRIIARFFKGEPFVRALCPLETGRFLWIMKDTKKGAVCDAASIDKVGLMFRLKINNGIMKRLTRPRYGATSRVALYVTRLF